MNTPNTTPNTPPDTTPDTNPGATGSAKRRRTPMIAGVTAGLLAGGAIGLAAMAPTLTSAAADESAVLVGDSPERGERLREVLQPLVDDNTIDATQADAVATHLVENAPERDGRAGKGSRHGRRHAHSVAADLLGVDRDTLRDAVRSGQSIADVADANGVDIQVVIDGLIADAESHIDLAIAHGLDEEAAAERLANVAERIEEGVYKTRSADD